MIDRASAGRQDPPFRLSMLIYDKRYRSLTFQVIVFILVMSLVWWLINNTITNLANLGKDIDFGFLFSRAGYDIPQQVIPYNSDDTHFRAALIGLLNTLLVSFLGCIAATIVGVTVGVLRLSNNWLFARLMTIYVEIFRNIPLLLWILIIFAVFTEITPAPRAYRGEEGIDLFLGMVAPTNRYTAIPAIIAARSPGALELGRIAIPWLAIIFIGLLVAAVMLRRAINARASRIQERTGQRPVTWPVNLALFVVPPIALWIIFGLYLEIPQLAGFNFSGGISVDNSFVALWLALTLYTGAFIAEIVRAGILSVSKGQSEAAFALGLRPNRTMNLVILPQALRVIVPPLISQYLNLTKNSSLAIAVGYMDLRGTLGGTTANQTGRELESILLMMLVYLAISLLISGAMNIYNSRVRLKER
ncbi:amino acid ABC transporter permease [Paracoccus aerodenitrificans]|uniref:amino acid ABC transporter permease n=1 Tax=Paracoccus aerodenitrificans TaxID=3017781 RepID=UPI0022F0740C|nr:ABC transporter permease subunit [Paracoccus aerodenitrificans]WBU64969.1 ABC transporter permease subunit [Paracoccus aerodenitrificans]